jgi:hypothetical protein
VCRIVVKHFDRLERVILQIPAHQPQFFQDVVRDGDDVTFDSVGLEDIEEFPRASLDEFGIWHDTKHFNSGGH